VFEITNAAAVLTVTGAVDGAGSLVKTGPGVLALGASNTYAGETTVSNGTLRLTRAQALATNTSVYLFTSAGALDLAFAGTNQVAALYLNGTSQPNGAYGSNTPPLTGSGYLQVGQGPPAPNGLQALGLNGRARLNWNVASGATGYKVKQSAASNGTYSVVGGTAGAAATNCTVNGLTNGTTCYFKVSATNSTGESADSAWASAVPQPPAPAFTPGGGVSVAPGTGAAAVTFGTQDGYAYRIAYKDDLKATNVWQPVIPPAPAGWTNAAGVPITINDTNAMGATQRFYRIEAQ